MRPVSHKMTQIRFEKECQGRVRTFMNLDHSFVLRGAINDEIAAIVFVNSTRTKTAD